MENLKEKKDYNEFYDFVADILNNQHFKDLSAIPHHGCGRYQHCVSVGYYSFRMAKKFGLDTQSMARGALLHDFSLKDWRKTKNEGRGLDHIRQMHIFKHPKDALAYSNMYFELNDKEKDIIVKHMFPMTLKLPSYPETWLITLVDKGIAIGELVREHTPRRIYRRHRFKMAA